MRKVLKKCLTTVLIILQVFYLFPMRIKADDTEEPLLYEIPVQLSNNIGSVTNITTMDQDGYIMVDFEEMCMLLDVDSTGSFLSSNSPSKEELDPSTYYKIPQLGNNTFEIITKSKKDLYYYGYGFIPSSNLKKQYEEAFNVDMDKCDINDGISVQKYRHSNRIIFMRIGSDVALLSGGEVTHLGTKVTRVENHIMVPLVMFLNVLDSYAYFDNDSIIVGPIEQTALDILSLTYLNSYYFDVIGADYVSREDYWTSNNNIEMYRKLKDSFQGVYSLNYQKIMEAFAQDTSIVAKSLAQQFCTASLEEKLAVEQCIKKQQLSGDIVNTLLDELTNHFFGQTGLINRAADEIYSQAVADWEYSQIQFEHTTFSSTNEKIDNYIRFQKAMAEELKESNENVSKIKAASKNVNVTAKTLGIALTGILSYYTAAHKIEHVQQENVDAIKEYLECYFNLYEKKGSVGDIKVLIGREGMHDAYYSGGRVYDEYAIQNGLLKNSKRFMESINEEIKLYDGKSKNIFKNDELRNSIFTDVSNAVISMEAANSLSPFIFGNPYGALISTMVTIVPDTLELIVNSLSGGMLDSKDALYESIYTMSFEDDSILLFQNSYDKDLNTQKKLAWTKLKSFYLTRMQYAAFEFGGDMEKFREKQPVLANECDQLLQMMSVLQYGINGVTQESLEKAFLRAKEYNDALKLSIDERPLRDEEIITLLNDYVAQLETMYGKSCKFILQRTENIDISNGSQFDHLWEGISEGVILGYYVKDYDNDDSCELLIVTLCDDNQIQLSMYEVTDKQVTLADTKYADTNSSYGVVELPCGSRTDGGICGILSCFVEESDNRIYLQSSDSYGLVADGCDTFIISTVYRDGKFEDYDVTFGVGSDIGDSIPSLNQKLSDIGVPNPDFYNIFYNSASLVDCFDGGTHEFLRAEQYTVEYEKENSMKSKIVTETVFATQDGYIEKPEVYIEEEPIEEETETIVSENNISVEAFENGFWMSWDEFQATFGEPNSNYTHRSQEYYVYENIEVLGKYGKISCQVGQDNRVYSVAWFAYEPNEELFETFLELLSERYDMNPSEYDDSFANYTGKEGENMVAILHSDTESQTSIQWSYNNW